MDNSAATPPSHPHSGDGYSNCQQGSMDLMGDLLSKCISETLSKLWGYSITEIGLAWGIEEELKKIQHTLGTIHSVIEDSEKRRECDMQVRTWLKKLMGVLRDFEDMLDELAYDTMKYKIERSAEMLSDTSLFSTSIMPSVAVVSRIHEVNKMLDLIVDEKDALNLRADQVSASIESFDHSRIGLNQDISPFVCDSEVFGRQIDISNILKMLLDNCSKTEEKFSVIPIVGSGGIGKTAIAQFVFNDENVMRLFNPRKWICVANNSGHRTLLSEVFRGICNGSKLTISNKSLMQKSIMEQLSKKRFLMVLDDVWNAEEWDNIRILLKHGIKGSKVVVITRTERVADTLGTVGAYHLNQLSEDNCYALFEHRAFREGGPTKAPTFEKIGREIVAKCNGIPLAVKALGGLMHSKKTVAEWLLIKNDENYKTTDDSDLMRVLRLSYYHLASPLKRCFAYCALFPKNTVIMKDDLIRQWMAQGFIGSSSNDHLEMEEIGDNYFQILCWNSFLQEVKENETNGVVSCKMHDPIHDLALSVAQEEVAINVSNFEVVKTLHLRMDFHNIGENLIEKFCQPEIKLRTFISSNFTIKASDAWLHKFKWLRVLHLGWVEELPSLIGNFKLLRYLCLQSMSMEVLPESICQLYLLETLDVQQCYKLKEFPGDIWKLGNLRHILLPPNQMKMPQKFGELHSLRTISPSLYLGEEKDGQGISELKHLNHLRGTLIIYNMENVRAPAQAKKAKLHKKENISHLAMKWSDYSYEDLGPGALKFPTNLQELSMENFPGVMLPTSTWSLRYLVGIELEKCKRLESISPPSCQTPPMVQWKMLKKLFLLDCPKLIIPFSWVIKLKKVQLVNIQRIVGGECSSSASEHPKSDNQDVDTTII